MVLATPVACNAKPENLRTLAAGQGKWNVGYEKLLARDYREYQCGSENQGKPELILKRSDGYIRGDD